MALSSLNLDAFYACARACSFTKAARELHITQSALSQRIKNLEDELGTTLLTRDRKQIRLTEQGEKLIRYCQIKTAAEAELLAELKPQGKTALGGVLRIGAFSSVARSRLLPSLAKLLAQYPGVQLRLVVRELYELAPLLRSGEIDFLLSTEPPQVPGLRAIPMGSERNVLIQKKGYQGPDIYLDHDEEDRTTLEYLGKKQSQKIRRHYLDDIYGIIDGVRLGLGRAVVPAHLITGLRDIEILNPKKRLSLPISLYYFEQPLYTRLHQTVLATLSHELPSG